MQHGAHIVYGSTIEGGFFGAYRETVTREGLPYQWKALNDQIPGAEISGSMRNFRIAAGRETGGHTGFVFQDSDAYKWLEAVAYSLRFKPDKALEKTADEAIELIAAAQQPDGYLDTYYISNGLGERWTNLKDNHELYCAGHLIEAAVAYYQATGKRQLLDVALKLVKHIDSVIGPEDGKKRGYPGHPVIEMALMRLYEITSDPAHLRLAKYFVDERGQDPIYFATEDAARGRKAGEYAYYQAHKPVREQTDAVGHAVRAMYLYSGMADVARETDDQSLKAACEALWRSTVSRRMYVTGSVGSTYHGEAFSFDYDLPNDTVYGETCAAIGLCFFARRMLALQPKAEYADVMERALYNGVISGMDLDGQRFFYVNPLEVWPEACEKDPGKRHVRPQRQKWFGCACCPPNLFRLLTSLEDYVAVADDKTLYMDLYTPGTVNAFVGGGELNLSVATEYPWDGQIALTCTQERTVDCAVALRIPGWCGQWTLTVNGEPVAPIMRDGYAVVERAWKNGDQILLDLTMTPRLVRANPRVRADAGKVALTRGPLVYCLEQADNGAMLHLLRMKADPGALTAHTDELGGVIEITADGVREADGADWGDTLYAPAEAPECEPVRLRFIPYYAWANRGLGEMSVWVRRDR